LGLRAGGAVRVQQGSGAATLAVAVDERLPARCVRIPAGHPLTATLGPLFGRIDASAAALEERKVS
jgi:NADH-quinone oxidoreductase subunit G